MVGKGETFRTSFQQVSDRAVALVIVPKVQAMGAVEEVAKRED